MEEVEDITDEVLKSIKIVIIDSTDQKNVIPPTKIIDLCMDVIFSKKIINSCIFIY